MAAGSCRYASTGHRGKTAKLLMETVMLLAVNTHIGVLAHCGVAVVGEQVLGKFESKVVTIGVLDGPSVIVVFCLGPLPSRHHNIPCAERFP